MRIRVKAEKEEDRQTAATAHLMHITAEMLEWDAGAL